MTYYIGIILHSFIIELPKQLFLVKAYTSLNTDPSYSEAKYRFHYTDSVTESFIAIYSQDMKLN